MKNDEDSVELARDKNIDDFLQDDFSLQMPKSCLDSKSNTRVRSNVPPAFLNSESNEAAVTVKNKTRTMISELNPEISTMMKSKKEKDESISKLESSYYELQAKWEIAEIQRAKDQAEIDLLNTQIESQTAFSLNVGAVMGNLVWRASSEREVITLWLTKKSYQNKVEEFVSIADRIIGTFFKTYELELPPSSTDEYQFARGLLGTLANMAAVPEGRTFLFDNMSGKSLLKNLVLFLPMIPKPSGDWLKSSIMVILWNMSVNKSALCYLFELKIGQVVAHCLEESNHEQIRLLGIELLQSLTHNLTDPQRLDDIFKYVPIENIRKIADAGRDKVGNLAQRFLDYLASNENIALRTNNPGYNE